MRRNVNVFEYDPGWMTDRMTISTTRTFWKLVDILREVAPLSSACVYANRLGYQYDSYTLVFVNWTEKSMGDLEAWLRVNPQDHLFIRNNFGYEELIEELENLTNGKDRFGYDPVVITVKEEDNDPKKH